VRITGEGERPDAPLRVLVISTSFFPKVDGMIRTVDNQCRALAEAGNYVVLVNAEKRKGHDDGVHPYTVRRASVKGKRGIGLLAYPSVLLSIYLEARMAIRETRFDVCLAYGNAPTVCALLLKLNHQIPVIESITDISSLAPHRGKPLDLRMTVSQATLRATDPWVQGYIFPTEFLRGRLESAVGMRFRRYRIIPDGVDTSKFRPTPRETQEDVILYVGNLRKRKGLEDLVGAAPEVIQKRPGSRFVFVGEGLLDTSLRRMVASKGVEGNFEFLGKVSDEDLVEQYNRATVYVVPTRFDGYPTSVLEAMAVEKPVITTRGSVSDLEGIVVENQTGFLMEVGDSKQLAFLITKVIEDKELARSMGLTARELVVRKHSLDRVRAELVRYLGSFSRNRVESRLREGRSGT
jgi:glycosyltransferase involved in cell wall biosynthesis